MEHDYDLHKADTGRKNRIGRRRKRSGRRCLAMLLSLVLTAGTCLPAMAAEQPGAQTEEAGAAMTELEQAAETQPEEISEETGADENVEEAVSGETEDAADDQDAGSAEGQTEDTAAEAGDPAESAESADAAENAESAGTAVTAETAAEVEPVESAVTEEARQDAAGETSEWLAEFSYSILEADDGRDCVYIEGYQGSSTEINVPGTAQVDGVTYPVTASRATDMCYADVERITLGSGFILPVSCSYYFSGLDSLVSVDLSGADASLVEDMGSMFAYCPSLKDVTLGSIDVSRVTNTADMFSGCSSLEEIDLSCFSGTGSVNSTNYMFYECSNLRSLDLGGWNWSNVWDAYAAFDYCTSLEEIITPDYADSTCDLPVCMEDESGNLYTSLPEQVPSIKLHAVELPGWLSDYRFRIDKDEGAICLEDYLGRDSEIVAPASAAIGGTEYRVEIERAPWGSGVTSLSFEEGFRITGWTYDCFSSMEDLEILDLRNVDFSYIESFDNPLDGLEKLQRLYIPANTGVTFTLPQGFTDDNGEIYFEVPGDLSESITLVPASVSEWLSAYEYTVSDDRIILTGVKRIYDDQEYGPGGRSALPEITTVPGSAVIGSKEFNTIELSSYMWVYSDVRELSFEQGVVVPEDCEGLFNNYSLEKIDLSQVDINNTVNAEIMFNECES